MNGQTSNQKEKLTTMIVELAKKKRIKLENYIDSDGLDIKRLFETAAELGIIPVETLNEINAILN